MLLVLLHLVVELVHQEVEQVHLVVEEAQVLQVEDQNLLELVVQAEQEVWVLAALAELEPDLLINHKIQ